MARVLIVEDSRTQAAILQADLEAGGYGAAVAGDGVDAWDVLQREPFDVVLTDIVMPRMDGLELCRRVKVDPALHRMPVIVLTQLLQPDDIVRALDAGADNFLTKPYVVEQLLQRLEHVLQTAQRRSTSDAPVAELSLFGRRFPIAPERQQTLDMLGSALEDLVLTNSSLREHQARLTDAQQALTAQLGETELQRRHLRSVLDAIPDAVLIIDEHEVVRDVNPTAAALCAAIGVDHPIGTPLRAFPKGFDHTGAEVPFERCALVTAMRTGRRSDRGSQLLLHLADGGHLPVSVTAAPVRSPDDRVVAGVAVVRDVSAAAFYDRVTGLPNRVLFGDRLAWALERAAESGVPLAVIVLGLARFTVVHDTLGRGAGEELLSVAGRRLVNAVRGGTVIARLGGDRFGIVVEDAADITSVLQVAERLADVFVEPVVLGVEHVVVSARTGIAISDGAADAETLIYQAGIAFARAAGGEGAHQLFDEDMNAQALDALRTEQELRHAIEVGDLVVHYQPVYDLRDGTVVECEALVRWQHPVRGLVAPAAFIPLAEDTGLILDVGRCVLDTAVADATAWPRIGGATPRVAVNLSARQLEDPHLVDDVTAALDRHGLPPRRLILEITETAVLRDRVAASTTLGRLRELDVGLALDDFGTGYSSLSYLRGLPVDIVKIDRSFIADVCRDAADAAIVQAVITLAQTLGFKVVAEGVETADDLRWLVEAGCDYAAGYHMARPQPIHELHPLLDTSAPITLPAAPPYA